MTLSELLLQRQKRKGFWQRIITGDEKWINNDNPKRLKAWVKPGEPGPLSPKRKIHFSKVMLCIWWDQKGIVYYELLQPGSTNNAQIYKEQLTMSSLELQHKQPEYTKRHEKVIFKHDKARLHVTKLVKETSETLGWEVVPHWPYSPDITPSDYHLFRYQPL